MKQLLLAACAAAVMSMPAQAALVDLNFQFVASAFSDGPVPFDPVVGKFSFAFDNAASFNAATTGLTVTSFTLPSADYAVQFAYEQTTDTLILSTVASQFGCGASGGTDSFCTFISNASSAPAMSFFYYASASTSAVHYAGKIDYGVTSGAVPEPASWAMMIGGMGLVGGALRSRRKVSATFA